MIRSPIPCPCCKGWYSYYGILNVDEEGIQCKVCGFKIIARPDSINADVQQALSVAWKTGKLSSGLRSSFVWFHEHWIVTDAGRQTVDRTTNLATLFFNDYPRYQQWRKMGIVAEYGIHEGGFCYKFADQTISHVYPEAVKPPGRIKSFFANLRSR